MDGKRLFAGSALALLIGAGAAIVRAQQSGVDFILTNGKITLPHRVVLEGIAEVFNVFNSPNWTITTVKTSPQYLQRTAGQNRTAQLGFRITF